MLYKMDEKANSFYINRKKEFRPVSSIDRSVINSVFDFAYNMSFGRKGAHRNHRSGGSLRRKNGEIFANAFQGKLAEYALYNFLKYDFEINEPDLDCYDLGDWDDTDFTINNAKVSIKSTKSFGNLLLLEEKDWNREGQYIPNINKNSSKYDFTILVRLSPSCEDIFKKNRWLYLDEIPRHLIEESILDNEWSFDIVGFVTHEDILFSIKNNFIIPKGSLLNGSVCMDASNYYIQAGDFHDINRLNDFLANGEVK